VDLAKLIPEPDRTSGERILDVLNCRFLDARITPKSRKVLADYLSAQANLDPHELLGLLRLTLCLPEYQLC
jgi:hypothetical protein